MKIAKIQKPFTTIELPSLLSSSPFTLGRVENIFEVEFFK